MTVHSNLGELKRLIAFQEKTSNLLPLNEQLHQTHQGLSKYFDTSGLKIALFHSATKLIETLIAYEHGYLVHQYGTRAIDKYQTRQLKQKAGLVDWVIRHKSILHVSDFSTEILYHQEIVSEFREGILSCVVVPIIQNTEIVGAVGLCSDVADCYTAEDVARLQLLANHIGLVITNSLKHQQELDSQNTLKKIAEFQAKTGDVLSLPKQIEQIRDILSSPGFFPNCSFEITLYSKITNRLAVVLNTASSPTQIFGVQTNQNPTSHILGMESTIADSIIQDEQDRVISVDDIAHSTDKIVELVQSRPEGIRSCLAVPMMIRHEKTGAFFISHPTTSAYFSSAHEQLIKSIANHIAIVLDNARRFELIQRVNHYQNQVADVLPLSEQFKQIQAVLQEYYAIDGLFIALFSEESGDLWFPKAYEQGIFIEDECKVGLHRYAPRKVSNRNGMVDWCIKNDQALIVNNFAESPMANAIDPKLREGVISCLVVPMRKAGITVGAIGLQHYERVGNYGQYDRDFLTQIANYTQTVIDNAEWRTRGELEHKRLETITDIYQNIVDVLSLDEQIRQLKGELEKHLNLDGFFVARYSEVSKQIRFVEVINEGIEADLSPKTNDELNRPRMFGEQRGIVDWVIGNEKTLVINDFDSAPERAAIDAKFIRNATACLAVPMFHVEGSGIVGVIGVRSYDENNTYNEDNKELLEAVAGVVAIVIENSMKYEFQAKELRAVSEFQKLISSVQPDMKELETVYDNARKTLADVDIDVSNMYIAIYDAGTGIVEFPLAYENDVLLPSEEKAAVDQYKTRRLESRKDLPWWIIANRQTLLLGSQNEFNRWRNTDPRIDKGLTRSKCWLGVPMIINEQVIGMIGLRNFVQTHTFTDSHKGILETVASQTAIAINNTHAYERQTQLVADRDALRRVSEEIILQPNLTQVLELILEQALQLTDSETGTVRLFNPDKDTFEVGAQKGVSDEYRGKEIPKNEGIVGWMLKNRSQCPKDVFDIDDVQAPKWSEHFLPHIPGTRSQLTALLIHNNRLLGAVTMESPNIDNFDDRDRDLIVDLRELAEIAILNAERYEEVQRGRDQIQALHDLDKEIIRQADDTKEVIGVVLDYAMNQSGAKYADLHLYTDGDRTEVYESIEGDDANIIVAMRSSVIDPNVQRNVPKIVRKVAKTRQAVIPKLKPRKSRRDKPIKAEIAVPLLDAGNNNRLIGVLRVESEEQYFSKKNADFLTVLAGQTVISIQNARNFSQAQAEKTRFELLNRFGVEMSRLTKLEEIELVYNEATRIAAQYTQGQICLRLWNPETQELVIKKLIQRRKAKPKDNIKSGAGWNGWVVKYREHIMIPDVSKPHQLTVRSSLADRGMRSYLVIPVQLSSTHEKFYGTLSISHEKAGYFNQNNIDFFNGLARNMALNINRLESIRSQHELENRAARVEALNEIDSSAFELTHRLGNDLGLIPTYVNDIREQLDEYQEHDISDLISVTDQSLSDIKSSVKKVLRLARTLKEELAKPADEQFETLTLEELKDSLQQDSPRIPENIDLVFENDKPNAEISARRSSVINVISNLITNASEAIQSEPFEAGEIEVRMTATYHNVYISVADNGPGIPGDSKDHAQVFSLFNSSKGSSGFGLWSARKNALANQGELTVLSSPEKTTFTLTLPRLQNR